MYGAESAIRSAQSMFLERVWAYSGVPQGCNHRSGSPFWGVPRLSQISLLSCFGLVLGKRLSSLASGLIRIRLDWNRLAVFWFIELTLTPVCIWIDREARAYYGMKPSPRYNINTLLYHLLFSCWCSHSRPTQDFNTLLCHLCGYLA